MIFNILYLQVNDAMQAQVVISRLLRLSVPGSVQCARECYNIQKAFIIPELDQI